MKKYKLIKLLGLASITTIPLIAAGCKGGPQATDQEKIIGESLMQQIGKWEDVKATKGAYQFYFLNNPATKISFYQPNTKTSYTNGTAGIFINNNATITRTPATVTYTLDTGRLQELFLQFATLDVTTGSGSTAKTFTQNVTISYSVTYNKETSRFENAKFTFDPQTSFVDIFQNRLKNLLNEKKPTGITNKVDINSLKSFVKDNYSIIYDYLWSTALPKNAVIEQSKDKTVVNTIAKTATFTKKVKLPGADKALAESYQVTFTINFSKENGRLIEIPTAFAIAQI